jgi:hypothetical protein
MAQFELNIYGNDDEIIKTYTTDRVRWGVFMQALELQDGLEGLSVGEQFKAISEFVKKIFPELTDEHLEFADSDDVFNTFRQLTNKARAIGGSSKNATGAANE